VVAVAKEHEIHRSVLLGETLGALVPRDGGVYVDATCGLGGHAEALLAASGPTGRLLAVDRDPRALELAGQRLQPFGDRVTLVESDFSALPEVARKTGHFPADGLIADLGVSSLQLDDAARGFSFQRKGPLDMRMGPSVGATAAELLEGVDADGLTALLRDLGEVKQSRRVALAILAARDQGALSSTEDLARVIEKASGGRRGAAIHPATQAFQALRIAVNRELEELEALLHALPALVAPGGRVAIISFHSLEDRLVKRAFRDPEPAAPARRGLPIEPVRVKGPFEALQKKPITATEEEQRLNPRSRSAKLRAARRRAPEEGR
jgi:16S rRNA (cytosine1402-N4)-methyltransferase